MPRDNFKREKEKRILAYLEDKNWYRDRIRGNPFRGRRVSTVRKTEESLPVGAPPQKEAPSQRNFHCTNCEEEITTTNEDRARRAKVSCPNCNQKYKLHEHYVTREGEMIQYED